MAFNEQSRTVNASKNIISVLVNKILIFVLVFINRRIFIKYIGVDYLGIDGLFANVLTLLSMADLGLGISMNASLYKPIAEKDEKKIVEIISFFKKVYIAIATIVTVLGLSFLPFLDSIIKMDSEIPHIKLYYTLFILKNTCSYLFVYKSSLLRADQKNYIVNVVETITSIIKNIVQIICIVVLRYYVIYLFIEVLSVVAQNCIASIVSDKKYPFLKNKERLGDVERKKILGDIFSVFLYKIGWSLMNGTDNIIISVIVGTISVGFYSNYFMITNTLDSILILFFSSFTAGVGSLVASESIIKRYSVFKEIQMISFWICSVVVICYVFLVQDFMMFWVGKDMLLNNMTVLAIALNLFISTCMRSLAAFREGTNMYREMKFSTLSAAILNLLFSVVLGKLYGISGIILATSLSKLATYFWYEPNVLFKKFFKRKPVDFYMDYLRNIIHFVIALTICLAINCLISFSSIFNVILRGVCFGVIVSIVYFIAYRNSMEFKSFKNRLVGIVKK